MSRLMDLYDLYNGTMAVVNTQQGGCLKPSAFAGYCNDISTELFEEKFADAEESQKNDDVLNQAYLVSINLFTTSVPGKNYDKIVLPTDFGHFSGLRFFLAQEGDHGCLCEDYDIMNPKTGKCSKIADADFDITEEMKEQYIDEVTAEKVDNARFGSASRNTIIKPSMNRPIVTQIDGGLRIVPKGVGIVVLDYFKLPVKAVFDYTTVVGTDAINYNVGGSTQLDWPDLVRPEFIARLKKKYASFTRNQQQYAEAEAERKLTQ